MRAGLPLSTTGRVPHELTEQSRDCAVSTKGLFSMCCTRLRTATASPPTLRHSDTPGPADRDSASTQALNLAERQGGSTRIQARRRCILRARARCFDQRKCGSSGMKPHPAHIPGPRDVQADNREQDPFRHGVHCPRPRRGSGGCESQSRFGWEAFRRSASAAMRAPRANNVGWVTGHSVRSASSIGTAARGTEVGDRALRLHASP